jgi:hypothetical protein
MAQTLRTRRLSPERKVIDGAAPVPPAAIATAFAEPPSPAHAGGAPHPALARIVRLLARLEATRSSRRELGCTTLEVVLGLTVISLLIMAFQLLARHHMGH